MPKDLRRPSVGTSLSIDLSKCKDIPADEVRILRDFANRALCEIRRIRKRHALFDELVSITSKRSNNAQDTAYYNNQLSIGLPELHTLLVSLEEHFEDLWKSKTNKQEKSDIYKTYIGPPRRNFRPTQLLPVVSTPQVKKKATISRVLIRRTQLPKVT